MTHERTPFAFFRCKNPSLVSEGEGRHGECKCSTSRIPLCERQNLCGCERRVVYAYVVNKSCEGPGRSIGGVRANPDRITACANISRLRNAADFYAILVEPHRCPIVDTGNVCPHVCDSRPLINGKLRRIRILETEPERVDSSRRIVVVEAE